MAPTKIILTGRPGVGKTTLIRRLAELLGERAAGFYTAEVRSYGERIGFDITTLSGGHGVLARVDWPGPPRVGRYGVRLADLEQVAVSEIYRGIETGKVLLIDEIGKMELASEAFRRAVEAAFRASNALVATAKSGADPFLDGLKAQPGVVVLEVTVSNRQSLLGHVLELLGVEG